MPRKTPETIRQRKPAQGAYVCACPCAYRRTPSAKNNAARVGMMTLPIQLVRFVMPVRKFMLPRVLHHRNDQTPESGNRQESRGGADEPDGRPPKCEVHNGSNNSQPCRDRHDSAGRVRPSSLQNRGGPKTRPVIPTLEKSRARGDCQ